MVRERLKPVWMGVLLGLLVITAPHWLFSNADSRSTYDAPWVYPNNSTP